MSDHCCAPARSGSPPAESETRAPAAVGVRISTLVDLAGGSFAMGSSDNDANPLDGEGPVRDVTVEPLSIDTVTVTNARFATFVKASGYVTDAERYGWSFVFHLLVAPDVDAMVDRASADAPWWLPVPGATGGRPKARGRRPAIDRTIPRCTCLGTMRRPTARGPAVGCRPRPNGSTRPAAG